MAIKDALLAEFKNEAANTHKMLERLPAEKFAWKPHEKSMTMGRLASHIAEIPRWAGRILEADEFDFLKNTLSRATYEDPSQILKVFAETQEEATMSLMDASDEILSGKFLVRRGELIFFELPRKVMLRNFMFNHSVHHRGQLSVYLRLLGVLVPGMYGPSADES